MEQEKKVLGILAIVFGAIALLGSWVPIINNLSFFIAIIALILGGIGLAVNRKRTKTLAVVGTSLSVVSIIIVLVTQSFYGKVAEDASKAVETAVSSASSSIESSQKKEEAKFSWTKAQFDALTVGEVGSGAGGANYDTVIAEHGEPKDPGTEIVIGDHTSKSVSWSVFADNFKSVTLTFVKQADGSWLLSNKIASGLE